MPNVSLTLRIPAAGALLAACAWLAAGDAPSPAAGASASELVKTTPRRIPWEKAFQQKSPNFTVITNTSEDLAKDVSLSLEQQFADFLKRFNIRKPPKAPLPVKIFAEKSEFQKYGKKASERAAGYFDPNVPEIVLFWSDDPEDVLSTLYHEVTHYFLSLYAPRADIPTWMDEGMAVYFETAKFAKGRLETGQIPYGRLMHLQRALKEGKNHPLRQLLRMREYSEEGYNLLAYAEGWSLVYFFVKANNGANTPGFLKYMSEIKLGRTREVAFERAFRGTPEQLEPVWKKWILELKMDGPEGFYQQALEDWYADRNEEALAACDEALKLDRKLAKALHLRGKVLFWMRRNAEARKALEDAIAADATDPRAWYYLARTYEALHLAGEKGDLENLQERAYLKAIELKPDYAEALGLLAWFYATVDSPKLRKIKEAVQIAERAAELDPTAEVLDTLAECYHQDGQKEKAVAAIQKAIALKPKDMDYFRSQLAKFQAGQQK